MVVELLEVEEEEELDVDVELLFVLPMKPLLGQSYKFGSLIN